MKRVLRSLAAGFLAALIALALPLRAQEPAAFKKEEIEQLVAPIALYPDALVAQVLMASTYPLEVVQADRWVKENQKLKGDALKAAVDKQAWDEAVKSLVAAPDVLAMMSSKLDWTLKLGDAVLGGARVLVDGDQQGLLARRQVLVGKGLGEQGLGPEVGAAQQVRGDLAQVEFLQGAQLGLAGAGRSGFGGHRASMKSAWRL